MDVACLDRKTRKLAGSFGREVMKWLSDKADIALFLDVIALDAGLEMVLRETSGTDYADTQSVFA